jgi:hypothetical protein
VRLKKPKTNILLFKLPTFLNELKRTDIWIYDRGRYLSFLMLGFQYVRPIDTFIFQHFICGFSCDILLTFTVHLVYCKTFFHFFVPYMIFELRVTIVPVPSSYESVLERSPSIVMSVPSLFVIQVTFAVERYTPLTEVCCVSVMIFSDPDPTFQLVTDPLRIRHKFFLIFLT